jgi:hypothetical protein
MLCLYPHPAIYPVQRVMLDSTLLKNLKFYLNLISNNIMMVCGGSGDLHPRTFNSFTSVIFVVKLASLPLYPRERNGGTH